MPNQSRDVAGPARLLESTPGIASKVRIGEPSELGYTGWVSRSRWLITVVTPSPRIDTP